MNIKRIVSLIISAVIIAASLSACAPNGASSDSYHDHTHTESNHTHDAGGNKTQNTSSKKQPNKNDNNIANGTQTGIKRPVVSGRDENIDYDKYVELPSQGKSVSERLFEDFESYDNKCLYFYNVKNTTYSSTSYVSYKLLNDEVGAYKKVGDEQEILDFKQSIHIGSWTAKKFTARTAPSIVIYFDDDYHLNVEGKIDGAFWLSLNAEYGKVYYIVPEVVYNYVVEYCG